MAEQTPNPQPTQQFTPEQEAARKDPSLESATAFDAGTSLTDLSKQVTDEGAQDATFQARPGERDLSLEETNRQRMIQTGELTEGMNPQLMQEKINLFTYGVENPTFGATVSSEPARQEFNDNVNTVQDEMATTQSQMQQLTTPEYRLYEDYTGEYQKAREQNKDIFERTVENIEKDFEVREAEQRDANRKRTGSASKSLARMGAFGRTGSSLSFLQDVDTQNQREMNKLLVQKSSILIQAAEAAQAKDLQLLGKLVAESHAITDQYNQVQRQRFEDSIATNDQMMKQNRFGWEQEDRAMGKLSMFVESGTEVDETTIKDLEKKAGVPEGFYSDLQRISKIEEKEEKLKSDIDFQKDMADLLNKIPETQKIQIGDQVLSGWKKEKDDVWKTTMTDSKGNVTGVTYDPSTKTWKTHSLGNVGASKDGWKIVEADGKKWRVNSLTGETQPITTKGGNMDPSLFDGFDQWAASMGNITTEFGGSTAHPNNPSSGEAFHPGYDIAPPGARAGQYKVEAFLPDDRSGTVIAVHDVDDNPYGKYVEVQDDEGRVWKYSHMHSIGVSEGDSITNQSYLGQMGNTGNVFSGSGGDGTHLDLRVYEPGKHLGTKKTESNLTEEEQDFQDDYQKQLQLINEGKKTTEQAANYLQSFYGFTDAEVEALFEGVQEFKDPKEQEFLNRDFFATQFTEDQLEQAAADAGFGDLGEGIFNLKDVDTEAYLNYLDGLVQQYRQAGMTDREILKLMQ